MEELAFEGVHPPAPPAASEPAASDPALTGPAASGPAVPGPAAPERTPEHGPTSVGVRLAGQIQRAHAAVVEAHQAVTAWQLACADPHGPAAHAAEPHADDARRVRCDTAPGAQEPGGDVQMAMAAEGDRTPFPLPAGVRVTARVRARLPRGELRMVDRSVRTEGPWGEYRPGSFCITEYDVPRDAWYIRENGGAVPQFALMEMGLQPAGVLSGWLGVAGEYPQQDLHCRNLEGSCRLLHDVALPGATVEQHVALRSHAPLPGGLVHRYGFELHTGGRPFCTGEAVHGYVTPELLAQQQGLDGGTYQPPWLERHSTAACDVRSLALGEDSRIGTGRLALLEDVALVPGGGDHGCGYVLCTKPVRADDWFFDRHFFRDPVMPGSAGVQMLHQAVYAYALHTGLADHLAEPCCRVAVGEELRWTYRGQILREHRQVRGEVHIRDVRRDGRRVLLRADGSVWRDDLRIYRVENIAVDIGPAGPHAPEERR